MSLDCHLLNVSFCASSTMANGISQGASIVSVQQHPPLLNSTLNLQQHPHLHIRSTTPSPNQQPPPLEGGSRLPVSFKPLLRASSSRVFCFFVSTSDSVRAT